MITKLGSYVRQHHVALLALFLALGGTSFAAASAVLPANSVGTKQLKKNAVVNAKIKNNAVNGAKVANDSLRGADVLESSLGKVPSAANADNTTHATSADNATNATNATNAAHATTADSAPYIDSLPTGKTLRGVWGVRGDDARQFSWISFGHRTAASTTFHFIAPGATPPVQCPGSVSNPQAQSGHTCVYAFNVFNLGGGTMAFNEAFAPEDATIGSAGRDGVILFFTNTTGDGAAYGTWAVTGN
jgi:hypothetical protein